MKVGYEELWEPWYIGEDGEEWPIPEELAERFRRAKAEMEAVWDELRNLRPRE